MGDKTSIEWTDELIARFWSHVEKRGPDECWPWKGARNQRGYGQMRIAGRGKMAHRLSLELRLGRPLIDGMNSCHNCDNPPCCNQSHLFEGTQLDNLIDCRRKGRASLKLSDDQVVEIRDIFCACNGRRGALSDLGRQYGVTKQQIRNIVMGVQRRVN